MATTPKLHNVHDYYGHLDNSGTRPIGMRQRRIDVSPGQAVVRGAAARRGGPGLSRTSQRGVARQPV